MARQPRHDLIAGTIRLFQRHNGISHAINNGVATVVTAFDYIVERVQSGDWKYIKTESLSKTSGRPGMLPLIQLGATVWKKLIMPSAECSGM